MNSKHLGSNFDEFLAEEGLLEAAEGVATKRVLAFRLAAEMANQKLSKADMARRMSTSRSALDRLLDPDSPSLTLLTLERAARVLGLKVRIELVSS